MGEWKAPLSLRVRQAFRRELEEAAAAERRTLANLGELLLEGLCAVEGHRQPRTAPEHGTRESQTEGTR